MPDFASSPAVEALNKLSIFSAYQGGAYREHSASITNTFGEDVATKLQTYLKSFARSHQSGLLILTGNAGTGKTAATEAFCKELGHPLPGDDGLVAIGDSIYVAKDLSGIKESDRGAMLRQAYELATTSKIVLCANEGVLRNTAISSGLDEVLNTLTTALRSGAATSGSLTIVNVNRQRPTADGVWYNVFDYLFRSVLWDGCRDCPYSSGACIARANAESLRQKPVQDGLRILVRYASATTPPTMRDIISLLAWSAVGDVSRETGHSCASMKATFSDLGPESFDGSNSYYHLLMGADLSLETLERSPLLTKIVQAGLGHNSDLEVDEWLRDASGAPAEVISLSRDAEISRAPLARTRTPIGTVSFEKFGEILATSEDQSKVAACIDALTDEHHSVLALWRERIYFEGSNSIGGTNSAASRLTTLRFFPEMLELASRCKDQVIRASEPLFKIIRGLNVLISGFNNTSEGLIIPESSTLFARDPGAFVPPEATLIHSYINANRLSLRCPDRGIVRDILDLDFIEIEFVVDDSEELYLTLGPDLFQAIREAEAFSGPVGRGVAFMAELRDFYGRLSRETKPMDTIRIATGSRSTPALISIRLPQRDTA